MSLARVRRLPVRRSRPCRPPLLPPCPLFLPIQLHTYVAKAAPTTGLLGESKERLEGLSRTAFASTEAEILKEIAEDDGRQDGATVTACVLAGNLLVTANVGDSRAVLGSMG